MDKDNKEPKKQNQSDYDVFGNRKASGKKKNSSSLRGLLDEEDSLSKRKAKRPSLQPLSMYFPSTIKKSWWEPLALWQQQL